MSPHPPGGRWVGHVQKYSFGAGLHGEVWNEAWRTEPSFLDTRARPAACNLFPEANAEAALRFPVKRPSGAVPKKENLTVTPPNNGFITKKKHTINISRQSEVARRPIFDGLEDV